MNSLSGGAIRWLVFCWVFVMGVGSASSQVILKEDFESGGADLPVPTTAPPFRVNDSGFPVTYRTTDHPFSSGSQYGYVNDNLSAPSPGNATRFMSTDAADTDQIAGLIGGQVTTLSFEFWESAIDNAALNNPGLGFGYYGNGVDLNAAGRNYRAFLRDGMLNPDFVVDGLEVAYTREVVQTIYMLCNDTANAVVNYRDGRNLAANQADVWIQEASGDPVYAFSVANQHEGLPNRGIGFRTFSFDVEEIYLNNILLNTGASFDRSAFETEGVSGDFDSDNDVDGRDFLAWQRGESPDPLSASDLSDWQDNYGFGPLAATTAVPEPSVVAMLLPGLLLWRKRMSCS
jgi:hypothetical protein